MKRGLGTQLRHLTDLLDGAVAEAYKKDGLTYRPRYTPVMRALVADGPGSVTQIAQTSGITQPAATQTIALMIREGLLSAEPSATDNRQKLIRITPYGCRQLPRLEACWNAATAAANSLDADLPFPLSELLDLAIHALAKQTFAERIDSARQDQANRHPAKKRQKKEARK